MLVDNTNSAQTCTRPGLDQNICL